LSEDNRNHIYVFSLSEDNRNHIYVCSTVLRQS